MAPQSTEKLYEETMNNTRNSTLPIRVVAAGVNDQYPLSFKKPEPDLFYILTYNIRSLVDKDRIIQLENYLKEIKWDILGLSEIKLYGQQIEQNKDYIFLYNGERRGRNGVGFIIRAKYQSNI